MTILLSEKDVNLIKNLKISKSRIRKLLSENAKTDKESHGRLFENAKMDKENQKDYPRMQR